MSKLFSCLLTTSFLIPLLLLQHGRANSNDLQSVKIAQAGTFQDKVVQIATKEWNAFYPTPIIVNSSEDTDALSQQPLEYEQCKVVNKYWLKGVGYIPRINGVSNTCRWPKVPFYCLVRVQNKLTCPKDKRIKIWDKYAWSAVFVSYVMRAAGAGDQFKYSSLHSDYIRQAVRDRDKSNAAFRGYPIDQVTPVVGDLICAPREKDKDLKYSDILKKDSFLSHCDIVVTNTGQSLGVIGGNVGDSVAKTMVKLDAQGRVLVTDESFRNWFVVIKNSFIDNN